MLSSSRRSLSYALNPNTEDGEIQNNAKMGGIEMGAVGSQPQHGASSSGTISTLLHKNVVRLEVDEGKSGKEMFDVVTSSSNLQTSPHEVHASPKAYSAKHQNRSTLVLEREDLPDVDEQPLSARKGRFKYILLGIGTLLLIVAVIGFYAFVLRGGGGNSSDEDSSGTNNSPTPSPPSAPPVMTIPSSLKIISDSNGDSEGTSSGSRHASMRALRRDLKLLNDGFQHVTFNNAKKDVEIDISTSTDGQKSFNAAIADIEQMVCALSKTLWDSNSFKPASRNDPTQYYATKVDLKQCGYSNRGNQTTMMEIDIRHTTSASGLVAVDVYIPGWVGRVGTDLHPNSLRRFEAFGRLDQKETGFEMNIDIELAESGDDSSGAPFAVWERKQAYLRFDDEDSYYFFSEGEQISKVEPLGVPAQWMNLTYSKAVSVRNSSALIYNDQQPGGSYAYLLSRSGDHVLMQNCTEGCSNISSGAMNQLPFFQNGDNSSGFCFNESSYTDYDFGYCLFSVDTGMFYGDDGYFWMNYTHEMDPRGTNELNNLQWANPFKVYYSVYPGSGCEMTLFRCEARESLSSAWEGGCYRNANTSDGLYNEYEYSVGGVGVSDVALKRGVTVSVGSGFYNVAPLRSLRVLKQSNGCGGIEITPPTWDLITPGSGDLGYHIPTSRPAAMRSPDNRQQICHAPETYPFSVNTGTQILATPVFFSGSSCVV